MTPTELAVSVVEIHTTTDTSERSLVDLFVEECVYIFHEGLIDSHKVADAFFKRRLANGLAPDRTQTKDYVQYLFRESMAHVCRHIDGTCYRFHKELECSAECDKKYAHREPTVRRPMSDCCFLEVTTMNRCPMGCDD
jgi:hypothetical protein